MPRASSHSTQDSGIRADARDGHIGLFWRILIPNACLLGVASALLVVAPPRGRVLIIVAGLAVMIVVNAILMRWAFAPLERLIALMERVDPLHPGARLHVEGPQSEVTLLSDSFNRMLDRLEAERRDSARRALVAQEGERRRVSTELHDQIGQSLTGLMLSLSRAAESAEQPRDELREAADQVSTIIDDVRAIARGLRPEALDHLGLASALNNLCEDLSARTGLDIVREISRNLPELRPETELVIYRIVQESLTNVIRHADASVARVVLRHDAGRVVAEVADDGVGMPIGHLPGGSGIRGMRERAVLVGAELDLWPGADGGVVVRLVVPSDETP